MQTAIGADMLVPLPDYSNSRPQDIPVTNPDLVRWMLLLAQLGAPKGEYKGIVYKLSFPCEGMVSFQRKMKMERLY